MKKKNYPITNIGVSSLLVIFVILCLTTFGALALTGANRDYQISRTLAERTKNYYKACNTGEHKLKEIDRKLAAYFPQTTESFLLEDLRDCFQNSNIVVTDSGELNYTVAIDEKEQLEIQLLPQIPQTENDSFYSITCWKATRIHPWNGDTTLHLLD